MLFFPQCKINLGLRILRKRDDGFHDLETIFYPVPLKDIIEILPAKQEQQIAFTSSGISIPGDQNNNLCIKAYHLIKNDFPELPAVKIHLHKIIPMGAGLGGGSSDASAVLKMLNQMFNLNINQVRLEQYALQLGSDCPFFLQSTSGHATGRGELLQQIQLDLSSYKILLVHPGIHISTAVAFSKITPAVPDESLADLIQQPVEAWKDLLVNDFETICFQEFPILQEIKSTMYEMGAAYSAMSGSGSSMFGLFKKEKQLAPSFEYQFNIIDL